MPEKVVIKKHRNKNEYLLTKDQVWVRNFCAVARPLVDINRLLSSEEQPLVLENELENRTLQKPEFVNETKRRPKVVIMSDGYGFTEKQRLLSKLQDVCLIATNKSLAKWKLADTSPRTLLNYYVLNNPYPEAMDFMPKRHFPKCLASVRSHPEFVRQYKGECFFYTPTPDTLYSGVEFGHVRRIDDYRNPICAALHLAYEMGAEKVLLFCCDDSMAEDRPATVRLENGLYTYPQHLLSQRILDAMCHWISRTNVKIRNHSSGMKLGNAAYIGEEELVRFFQEEDYE